MLYSHLQKSLDDAAILIFVLWLFQQANECLGCFNRVENAAWPGPEFVELFGLLDSKYVVENVSASIL